MTITTKFQPRQKVWTMIGSDSYAKPVEVEIKKIKIIFSAEDKNPTILYSFQRSERETGNLAELHELALHQTKEQLIAALYK